MKNFFNKLLLILTSLIGGGACTTIINEPDEYGCPHADYIIRGNVMEEGTQKPIEGARVIIDRAPMYLNHDYDTLYTNKDGVFTEIWSTSCGTCEEITVNTTQTGYAPNDTVISLRDVDYIEKRGSGTWHEGRKEKDVTIELKKEQ
ncbi:MAG: radical SAM-associated putative lipoprotein [Paludibacteraceae bacterium]|nr:radical SAM-associated putative lipoprotein [Paludibacteraceae bacterium]